MNLISNFYQYILFGLLGAVGLILLIMLLVSLGNRIVAKMGLRNIPRRPAQTVLIIFGLTLSTVIIVSSLSTGSTLSQSITSQAVDAYGTIDEVMAPPLLGTLAQFGIDPGSNQSAEAEFENSQLFEGGLSTILALFSSGLPSIDQERYAEFRADAAEEPLIDAVAPSILWPIIVRNRTTGQGEPLGFIFAVDNEYREQFGLQTIDGQPADMEALRPGVGNVFELAATLVQAANLSASNLASDLGFEDVGLTEIAAGAVAVGAALSNPDLLSNLPQLFDNALPPENTPENPSQGEGTGPVAPPATLEGLAETLGIDPNTIDIQQTTNDLLSRINLNTLGEDIDQALGQVGLELRQGEVYLNRMGAEQLDARVGDLLDVYIGPVPLPYRVVGIVEEASPVAALTPVVVMSLDEAQRLLFMKDQINSVVVSNQGDAYTGLDKTDAVNERLRVLALNDQGIEDLMSLLRQPEIRPTVERTIARQIEEGFFGIGPNGNADGNDGPPAFVAGIIETTLNLEGFGEKLETIAAALDEPEISDELREALANRNIQLWLTDLDGLPEEQRQEVSQAISQLTEMELIEPLSKQTVVTAATVGGTIFSSVFALFGFFSILAAVLLIFMIFVMLASERRSEMGMARAIGMQRRQLVQMYVTEGLVYDLLAAAVGVALGVAVSYAMVGFVGGLFDNIANTFGGRLPIGNVIRLRFSVVPTSLLIAYCLGVLLTFIVVTFSSWRVSRLNIVSAIRNLPESNFTRRVPLWRRIIGPLFSALLLGAGLYIIFGFGELTITRTQLGATSAISGGAFLLGRLLQFSPMRAENRHRIVYSIIGMGLILIWVTPWNSLLRNADGDFIYSGQDPASVLLSFALSTPLIILGAILTVMYNADLLVWIANRLLGGIGALTPVLRAAIAYPLSARFRTGMAMLLFAMIISTVVIMAVVIQATQSIVKPPDEEYIGFDVRVDPTLLSIFSPMVDLEAAIAADADFPAELVEAVAQIDRRTVDLQEIRVNGVPDESTDASNVRISGVNSGYLDQAEAFYHFKLRAPGYENDAAVWQALRERDDVAIATGSTVGDADSSSDFAGPGDGPPGGGPSGNPNHGYAEWRYRLRHLPGLTEADDELPTIELTIAAQEIADNVAGNRIEPQPQTIEIIGVLAEDDTLAGNGIWINQGIFQALGAPIQPPGRIYVKSAAGVDARDTALAIEKAFIGSGLNATILAETFAAGQAVTRGVLRLFQGFMALGLFVGIAALGVISSRTVVERRQQIGMLRAIGYQPNMVALSFVLEASFISLAGILIGTVAGVVLGRNIVGEIYTAISGQAFDTPWGAIALVVLLTYAISLLTTIFPAIQASRIYPAEALRYD